jgi:hypothetical protein
MEVGHLNEAAVAADAARAVSLTVVELSTF